ncbi:MAG: hypothetical protein IIB19_00650 [Chloroflexi bacterium]|nr:hypothetical protein [Chloroflexota bacterium]
MPFTVKDDAGASHSGEFLIVRTWHPDLELNPSAAFTIVLVEQPLQEASPPPTAGAVVVCAPATPVRLPATVAETAIADETGDASPAPPLRLPRSALAAYAEGALLAALPLSTSAQEVFGAGTRQPRLAPLIDHVLAAARLADACWRSIDQMLSSPRPPARVARPQRLRDRLSAALAELPAAAASGATGEAAIARLGEIANGAAPETVVASPATLADDVAFVCCLKEQPKPAAELASMLAYLEAAQPGPQQRRLLVDRATTREQLSFVTLLSEPHRLDGMRATFEIFRNDYIAAYSEHHRRYWQAWARLRAVLDEAAPIAQTLARLNTLSALGQPLGRTALTAYRRLTREPRSCSPQDLEAMLRERPGCQGCQVTLEIGVPSEETEEVLRRLQAALSRQQARLANQAVRRILARGGERIEQFLKIVQASDLTGLAQVLDDELLAFLSELLAQPVSPAPAALDLLQELIRAHPTVSEEQVEAVTQTLRQLLIEQLASQQAADPSREAAIRLAATQSPPSS